MKHIELYDEIIAAKGEYSHTLKEMGVNARLFRAYSNSLSRGAGMIHFNFLPPAEEVPEIVAELRSYGISVFSVSEVPITRTAETHKAFGRFGYLTQPTIGPTRRYGQVVPEKATMLIDFAYGAKSSQE